MFGGVKKLFLDLIQVCLRHLKAYADHTALDPTSKYHDPKSTADEPRWLMVDVRLRKTFKNVIPLKTLKSTPALEGMNLLKRGNRLSIQPVSATEWNTIMDMA